MSNTLKLNALTHAKEYTKEYIDSEVCIKKLTEQKIDNTKTIDELCEVIRIMYDAHSNLLIAEDDYFKDNQWSFNGKELSASVIGFYNAILSLDIDKFYSTEDRLLYRVYSGATEYSDYFNPFEPNLTLIAKRFYEVGAITKNQFNKYKTKFTLNTMAKYVSEDGSIDMDILFKYTNKDLINDIFNMDLLKDYQ